ncbi:hypothetical protein B566_EDAN001375 [Ephemera danica]|nr:hypothetical protein B566_EDAN001375 [Ephemera danica]
MMQEDSNGESSFEFVHKKVDDPSDVTMSNPNQAAETPGGIPPPPTTPQAPVNLLSSVPPPSALPSFVVAQPSPTPEPPINTATTTPTTIASNVPRSSVPPVSSQPIQYPAPTFSAAIPHSPDSEPNTPSSPQEEHGPGSSLMGWVKGAVSSGGLLSHSGGDIDIVVASEKEVKISPIREAFQAVFGRATVSGQEGQPSMVAAQPVGFAAGCRAAGERIAVLRQWFDLGVLILDDPVRKISLQTFTQLTPVPARVIERAQVDTASDYPLRWSGLAVPIGKLMAEHLQVTPGEWHFALTGVSRREMLLQAAKSLAGIYKNSISS